ncbi:uncharacterized protein KZ484_004964 isoform 1-T8 [Pholidichthys leucotaenia]
MALLKMAVLLLLLRVSFTSADSLNIKAEPGQTVVLQCRAPFKNTDITVEYSRADLEPEQVFLHRDNYDIPDGQHELFKNRVELLDKQMKNGNVSLVLNHVTFSDSGVYECRVFYKEGEKTKEFIKTITLTVGKPEDKEKSGEGNQQDSATDSLNIKAEPGQTVVLPCRAPVNNTDITVEYSRADLEPEYVFLHRDKQDIQEGQHESFKNRVELQDKQMKDGDVSLVLNHVTFSDSGVYECRVFYKEGEKTKEFIKTITLTVGKREDEEKRGEGNQQDSATGLIVGVVIAVVCVALAVFGLA